jgi:hypothetical protein
MQCRLFLPCILSLILLSPAVTFADFTGPVISILDGDTIEVLPWELRKRQVVYERWGSGTLELCIKLAQ